MIFPSCASGADLMPFLRKALLDNPEGINVKAIQDLIDAEHGRCAAIPGGCPCHHRGTAHARHYSDDRVRA